MHDIWKQWQPKAQAHEPPDWTEESVYAIRALYEGQATKEQQQLALRWIEYVCGVGEFQDMTYRPGGLEGDRQTAFAEGKRFVGLQILKARHPAMTEAIERAREREAAAANAKKRGT